MKWLNCSGVMVILLCTICARAAEYHGLVLSNELPLPGAMVIAIGEGKTLSAFTNSKGEYSFPDLADGAWEIEVKMPGFATQMRRVVISDSTLETKWTLKMLSLQQAVMQIKPMRSESGKELSNNDLRSMESVSNTSHAVKKLASTQETSHNARHLLLVNGSTVNGATTSSSLNEAFGNTRSHSRHIYNGGFALIFGNSALNARPFSLTGADTPTPSYSQLTAVATLGGPLVIPHLMRRGPNFFLQYQWTRNNDALTDTGLVPTLAQRAMASAGGNAVTQALLALYPSPNVVGIENYNYQIPVLNGTHQDALQLRLSHQIGARDSLSGSFAIQSDRGDQTNLFRFRDLTNTLGINAVIRLQHRFENHLYLKAHFQFSRLRTRASPYFENRTNVSRNAGMTGNDQSPENWGPPTLIFSSGIASLTDGNSSFNRNRTDAVGGSLEWYRGRHDFIVGGDFRRREFNYYSQQDPRGTFTFTGQAYGSAFADFLHGVPDTASINYGNPDKYLRQSLYDIYGTDKWHVGPDVSLDLGVRWEYSAPITELKNRMVNLDVLPGFASVAPVLATNPVGPISGSHYPRSLLRPDRSNVEPRIGVAWRPIAASSLLVRAGYGIYPNTSVYPGIALQLAQQAPFSTSINASNSICSQSLATGPTRCSSATEDTFGIVPNFKIGYAQIWQLSVQRDLPGSLQLIVTYRGIKGTHGVQEFLPNTYPLGASNPCPSCASGFLYETSTGTSTREAGTVQLRRRLRNGFTASAQYTYSKSMDDDSVVGGQGGLAPGATSAAANAATMAQNWRDLGAERGPSNFDQRNLLKATFQYTTGMGLGGGTLLHGWLARIYKEWTIRGVITAGSGLPETPVYLAAVNGTGFTGSIRPDRTGAPIYAAPPGRSLNPNAYTAPKKGQWGTAGRNSIVGPDQFSFNASLAHTFRLKSHLNLNVRVDATNVLNHVTYTSYNATVDPTLSSPLFGLPVSANAMRSLQITTRLRF